MGGHPIEGGDGGGRSRQKRGLAAEFQVEMAQEIETFLGKQSVQGLDFEALETAARGQALGLAARALEGWLNADSSDHEGPQLACLSGVNHSFRRIDSPNLLLRDGWLPH